MRAPVVFAVLLQLLHISAAIPPPGLDPLSTTTLGPGATTTMATTTKGPGATTTMTTTTNGPGATTTMATTTKGPGATTTMATTTMGLGATTTMGPGATTTMATTTKGPGATTTIATTTKGPGATTTMATTTKGPGATTTMATTTMGLGATTTMATTTKGPGATTTIATTTKGPGATTTMGLGATTTMGPGATTTMATTTKGPGATTTIATTTKGPGATTTIGPGAATTMATTTKGPGATTTMATTTKGPGASTTMATTTIGPGATTTMGPDASTTTGPGTTTTMGPGATTTLGPGVTTTMGPGATTTMGPGVTTTMGPGATTTMGPDASTTTGPDASTTTGPGATTTMGPGTTTTMGPGVTTTTGPEAPQNVTVVSSISVASLNDTVRLTCNSNGGSNNTYQWTKDEAILGNNSTLTIANVSAVSGGNYICTVSNAAGTGSDFITLYVAPYFTLPPDEQYLTRTGSTINVSCVAAGFPSPTVNWVDATDMVVSNDSRLLFSPVRHRDYGVYLCLATIEVDGLSFDARSETTLIVSPQDSVVVVVSDNVSSRGSNVTFDCRASGGPNNSFTWTKGEVIVGTKSSLLVTDVDASSGGDYRCIVSNVAGSDAATATLYINPYIITPLVEQFLTTNGSSLNIRCNVNGFPPPSVVWFDETMQEVAFSSLLQFDPVVFGDEGLYYCVATIALEGLPTTTPYMNMTALVVSPEGSIQAVPSIINGNQSDNATFICSALGGPSNTFHWTKAGEDVVISGYKLSIVDIAASDGGMYVCVVENPAGNDSITVSLNVSPEVIEHPQNQNVTSFEGTITLNCTATGFPAPNILWYHNLSLISLENSSIVTEAVDAFTTRSFFMLRMAERSDSGMYSCRAVVHGYEVVQSNIAIVLVQDFPEQPQNVTAVNIQSRFITLTWIEPHDNNAAVLGYLVIYNQPSFAGGGVAVQNALQETANLTGLFPGVTYNITVIAYNDIGNSSESETISFITLEDVPVNSPQNVTAMPISSTAVYVEWKEVPPIDRNGVIIAYQVLYQSRVPGQISASVLTSNLSVLLEGLHPFMEYGILVSASTSVGSSPLSDVVYVTTLEGRPGPPFGVMTLSNSSTQVIVSWEGVLDPNGIILLYEVLYLSTSDRQVRSVNITDNTSRTVVLSNLEEFTEYNITVRAYTSVGAGPETSAVTVRTLQESPTITSLTPITAISNRGDTVTFTCLVEGGSVDSYRWTMEGSRETFGTNSSLDVHVVDATSGGSYTCTVSNTAGSDSASATLYVAPYIISPIIRQALVSNGSFWTILCEAGGFPSPTVTWLDVPGIYSARLSFYPVEFGDEGVYRCKATAAINEKTVLNTTWEITVVVSPQGSVSVPMPVHIGSLGSSVSFDCFSLGGPENSYSWTKDRNVVGNMSTLVLTDIDASLGGVYNCAVSNPAGTDSARATLYVTPYVAAPLEEYTLTDSGASLNISCGVASFPSPTVFYWMDGTSEIVSNSSLLTFDPVNYGDEGLYRCRAFTAIDGMNFTTNDATILVVSPVGSVRASPSVLNTTIGDSAMFTCTSLGGPANHLYWKKTSSDLIVSNSSVLSLLSLTAFDDGQYQCIASNMAGADIITVTLYVDSPMCIPDEVPTPTVVFRWPETTGGSAATFTCPNNNMFTVSRRCLDGGRWDEFDQEGCGVLSAEFDDITMESQNLTNETLGETVEMLSDLVELSESSPVEQNTGNLNGIANVLANVANFVNESNIQINETVVQGVVDVLNSLTQWAPDMVTANTSSQIVQSFETVATTYTRQIPPNMTVTISSELVTVTAENAPVEVLQKTGRNIAFGDEGASDDTPVEPGQLLPQQEAAISLPASLFERVGDRENVGVIFALYENSTLFPVRRESGSGSTDVEPTVQTQVGSQIVAATVDSGNELRNLPEPVMITFRLQLRNGTFLFPGSEMCVSWDFGEQNWVPSGCLTMRGEEDIVTCSCNHLTNFAMLVDICLRQEDCQPSKVDIVLTYVSYIGMPISIVCLVLTLVTMVAFKKLREKVITKYHIQLSLSLLMMMVVALVVVIFSAEKVNSLYGGCVTMSVLVHYFALVSVMLMAAEALLMFRKLVTPFAQITIKYNVIVSTVCWSVPVVPVLIPLIMDLEGGHAPVDDIVIRRGGNISFCFLSRVEAFWGAFLGPLLAVMLFNIILFVCITVVLIQHVRRRSLRTKKGSSNLKTVFRTSYSIFGLSCLFGLTWLFAILTFSSSLTGLKETFQLLFTIFNSLQGAFIFLFTCVLSPEARAGWKSLFCGRESMQHKKLSQYSTGKAGSTSTGTRTLSFGMSSQNPLFSKKDAKKKRMLEDSLILRTFSVSTYIPEEKEEVGEEEEEDVFSDIDSEIEYQLQLKPQANKLSNGTESVMDMVAVPVLGSKADAFGGNVESSVTVYVNTSVLTQKL